MRVPLSKVYRAFKVLDEFTDEQCRGYVRRAMRKRFVSMVLVAIVTAPICLAVIVVGVVALIALVDLATSPQHMGGNAQGATELLLMVLAIVLPLFPGLMLGLCARDLWLRYAVRKELVRSTCPACEYQLLGLPAQDGLVRCPECGNQTRVDLLGLSAADLAMVRHVGGSEHPPLASPIRR